MQKIMKSVLENMISYHINDTELGILLYIARFQDDMGMVAGVHYKEVCEAVDICFQSLYNALSDLESKNIIRIRQSHHGDRDIYILGNEDIYSLGQGQATESYLSLHHPIFHDKNFKKMKANAKLIAMLFVIYTGANDKKTANAGHYVINKENFFIKYSALLNVKKDTLRRYLGQLRHFFSIYIRKGSYYVVPKKNVFAKGPNAETDSELFIRRLVSVAWRRAKKNIQEKYSGMKPESFLCFMAFIQNYLHRPGARDKLANCFLEAFKRSSDTANTLNHKYIHKLLREELILAGASL